MDAGGAFAAYITGNVASNLIGRLLSAGVADHLGIAGNFYFFAALNLGGAALVYGTIRKTMPMPTGEAQSSSLEGWIVHLRNPSLRAAFGIGFCILFAFIGTFTYVNFVLVREPLSLGMMQVGFAYFVFLPSVITTLLAGRVALRFGTRFTLWSGLTLAAAKTYADQTRKAGLMFVEQPLAYDDIAGLRKLTRATKVPIGIDEGIHSLADVATNAKAGAGGISLKLIKLGGLGTALEAARLCQRLRLKVNVAAKIAESSLASAAAIHLACAVPSSRARRIGQRFSHGRWPFSAHGFNTSPQKRPIASCAGTPSSRAACGLR